MDYKLPEVGKPMSNIEFRRKLIKFTNRPTVSRRLLHEDQL